jgi:predicted DNA-binding transcriptional regulator YafY
MPGLKPLKGLPGLKDLPGPRSSASAKPADPGVLDLIRHALAERRPIAANYSGKHRELIPIELGTKDGKHHLWAYQFGGESTHQSKCLVVADLAGVELLDDPWQEPPADRGPGSCIDEIIEP